ncbi:PadR family transcriptional regulator [Paenibacillus profundus]|uniref:PadR family transcriptional regulator n=1 Tax=Paenibacillus profundus TaxID=1173085 RepID=A0ABS8YFU4_9BACL|nr:MULTISPECIES: PadR family transcriptional regulator [Paenibacillus]MCE5170870.1 PadR family transcriptional regulator [Paenibacillus profundus]
MLEHIILGLLLENEMNGYELKKTIDHTVGIFYSASYGSLYPALKRLADKQLVNVTAIEDSKNKKIYSILPAGKEAFLKWLSQPLQLTKNEHLLKIFFYDYLDEDTRQTRLAEYQFKVANERERLKNVERIVAKELTQLSNPQQYYYRLSVLQYGLHYFEMENSWVEDIMERKNRNNDEQHD